jgi:hypothetical protein
MTAAVYEIDGDAVLAGKQSAGPWNPTTQHGGALAALAVWRAERIPATSPMRVAQVAVNLIRPAPLGLLDVRGQILRSGRKIQLCEVMLSTENVVVMRAVVLKTTIGSAGLQHAPGQVLDFPLPNGIAIVPPRRQSPFNSALEMRVVRGDVDTCGPAAVWLRYARPIVEGWRNSPAMRAAIAADFCLGISAVLSQDEWTYMNGDMTLNIVRDPVGEWILLDAETWLGPTDGGLSFGRLGDADGYFGRASQTLVVERRQIVLP